MRFRILILAWLAMTGCGRHEPPPPTTWPTQQQFIEYTARALTALRFHQNIRLPNGRMTPAVGEFDSTKQIRYWIQADQPAKVLIQVPTRSRGAYSYTTFVFNTKTGDIVGLSWGMVH